MSTVNKPEVKPPVKVEAVIPVTSPIKEILLEQAVQEAIKEVQAETKREEEAAKLKEKQTKEVLLRKTPSGSWELVLTGNIKRQDINHLRRVFPVLWNKLKRNQRLEKGKSKRDEFLNDTKKEKMNAA